MKHLLVPTDFSACAYNAIDFAIQSAKILQVEVTLLHVFEVKGNVYTDYMGVNMEYNQFLLEEVEKKLQQLKNSINESEGVSVNTLLIKGQVKEVILQVAEEKNIDMIVMGTFGATGLKEKLWGSKTASIIGNCSIPVLSVPYEYEWKKPANFLLATDNLENENDLLDFIFEMSNQFMAQMHVAVFTDEDDDNAVTVLEHTRKIPKLESNLKNKYHEEHLTASHLFGKEFVDTLQQHIKEKNIDILVMVTHPRSFWERIFHPSLTQKMTYHTNIPVLAIPIR